MTLEEIKKACRDFNIAAQKMTRILKENNFCFDTEIIGGNDLQCFYQCKYIAALPRLDIKTGKAELIIAIN